MVHKILMFVDSNGALDMGGLLKTVQEHSIVLLFLHIIML